MTEDEKCEEITRLGDLGDCIDNAIKVIGAQLTMAAREMGKDRKWFEECADQLRDDLMLFWDYIESHKGKERLH